MPRDFTNEELAARAAMFWAKVQRGAPDECWPWRGAKNPQGYGRMVRTVDGRVVDALAHRTALMLSGVEIPKGMHVLHSCDNPPCCNPAHLRAGTAKDNAQDRVLRKRHTWPRGARNAAARLTADQVLDIRKRYGAGGWPQTALAQEFGMAQTTISAIVRRAIWADLR